MRGWIGGLTAVVLLAGGCATAPEAGPDTDIDSDFLTMMFGVGAEESEAIAAAMGDTPLGSKENPIRANMPEGQRAYLSRLRCADGRTPNFERVGSFGIGPYGSIIDGYEVVCAGSTPARQTLFIDMYHPGHVETRAPAGYTIRP